MRFSTFVLAILVATPAMALEDGLYTWLVKATDGTPFEVTAILKTNPAQKPVAGNIFLYERQVLFSNQSGEIPITISKRGESFWFAKKKAQQTFVIAQQADSNWLVTLFNYNSTKPGDLKRDIGYAVPKMVSLTKLDAREADCADVKCLAALKAKYFDSSFRPSNQKPSDTTGSF